MILAINNVECHSGDGPSVRLCTTHPMLETCHDDNIIVNTVPSTALCMRAQGKPMKLVSKSLMLVLMRRILHYSATALVYTWPQSQGSWQLRAAK